MAPFVQLVGLSRSQSVRIGKQVLSEISMGDIPGVDLRGFFAVPIYADLADGNTRKDLQHHGTLGSYIDLALSATITSDLFWATRPTLTSSGGTASPVTVGTTGVLQSRTYGVTSANSSLSKIAASLGAGATFVIPTPVGGTRGDVVVANAKGQFSIIQGVPGGAAATCPAGFTLLGTVSTTTGGVVTATATGPTS